MDLLLSEVSLKQMDSSQVAGGPKFQGSGFRVGPLADLPELVGLALGLNVLGFKI